MFGISCLDIWWRHNIWISKKLKFPYLRNERSFSNEKPFALVSHVPSLKLTKQTSKNVVYTIFKSKKNIAFAKNHESSCFRKDSADTNIPTTSRNGNKNIVKHIGISRIFTKYHWDKHTWDNSLQKCIINIPKYLLYSIKSTFWNCLMVGHIMR